MAKEDENLQETVEQIVEIVEEDVEKAMNNRVQASEIDR